MQRLALDIFNREQHLIKIRVSECLFPWRHCSRSSEYLLSLPKHMLSLNSRYVKLYHIFRDMNIVSVPLAEFCLHPCRTLYKLNDPHLEEYFTWTTFTYYILNCTYLPFNHSVKEVKNRIRFVTLLTLKVSHVSVIHKQNPGIQNTPQKCTR